MSFGAPVKSTKRATIIDDDQMPRMLQCAIIVIRHAKSVAHATKATDLSNGDCFYHLMQRCSSTTGMATIAICSRRLGRGSIPDSGSAIV